MCYVLYTDLGGSMTEREPRTVRVDPDVWDEFTSWVERCEGRTWGEIGRHLEIAMREHMDADRAARMEQKLDEVLDAVSEGEQTHTHRAETATDGSGKSCDTDDRYTAKNVAQADPPKTNAAVSKKIDYLTAVVDARAEQKLHREKFRDKEVQPIWDYADADRADALVEKTIERLGLKQHPKGLPLYVTPEEYDRLEAEFSDTAEREATKEVADTFDALEAAEVDGDD